MTFETIIFSVKDGIGRITFNRPDKLNSFTQQMHVEMREALSRLMGEGARVLVLTGAGRAFCAGQDLGERVVAPGDPRPDLGESIERNYKPLVMGVRNSPIPVIASVNGVAAGAGANLALACDLVIAARSAIFIQPFCNLGLLPDAGGTWTLPRLVGGARALGLTMLGEKLPAEQAAAWGLIWRCVDDADLPGVTDQIARRLAAGPTRGLACIKRALHSTWERSFEEALNVERDAQRELGATEDYAEAIAAFVAKRPPRFKGQ